MLPSGLKFWILWGKMGAGKMDVMASHQLFAEMLSEIVFWRGIFEVLIHGRKCLVLVGTLFSFPAVVIRSQC